MAALNRVMLIGGLGRDPEVRMTPSGQKVASFSIAVNEIFKDRNGAKQERVEWVNIVLWRRQAEIAEQYLRKGSKIYIEGKLQTQSWDDQNGQKRYKTEVVGSNFQMLGGKPQGNNPSGGPDSNFQSSPPNDMNQDQGFGSIPPAPEDDLPF
jgi:single-strand DNA-binding protein